MVAAAVVVWVAAGDELTGAGGAEVVVVTGLETAGVVGVALGVDEQPAKTRLTTRIRAKQKTSSFLYTRLPPIIFLSLLTRYLEEGS